MNHSGCIEEKAIKTIFAAANMNSTFDSAFIQKNTFSSQNHICRLITVCYSRTI